MNTESQKSKIRNQKFKNTALVYLLMIFFILNFTSGYIEADEQSEKEARLLNLSLDEYKEKVADERKILEGLKKLLEIRQHEALKKLSEIKQREALSEEGMTTELVTVNQNLSINMRRGNYGTVLYSIRADFWGQSRGGRFLRLPGGHSVENLTRRFRPPDRPRKLPGPEPQPGNQKAWFQPPGTAAP